MSKVYEELVKAYDSIKDKIPFAPKMGIVLGSGLGNFSSNVKDPVIINYEDIEGFPVTTVGGHKGRYVFGYISDYPVVLMDGRIHYYEGYDMQTVVMPIRLMKMMGTERVLLTNAAGGISRDLKRGDLMIIDDHVSSLVPSPLVGENISELGTRFPDMTEVYSKKLYELLKVSGYKNDLMLKSGVYLQTSGPNYETPAEIAIYKKMGISAVGMSTACEAMAARHCGMEVCGVSCITNLAAGMGKGKLSHKEVEETAALISDRFASLIIDFIALVKLM